MQIYLLCKVISDLVLNIFYGAYAKLKKIFLTLDTCLFILSLSQQIGSEMRLPLSADNAPDCASAGSVNHCSYFSGDIRNSEQGYSLTYL